PRRRARFGRPSRPGRRVPSARRASVAESPRRRRPPARSAIRREVSSSVPHAIRISRPGSKGETMLSYAHGACDEPLLGETIGHNLERTAARVPDVEALISCQQGVRYTYGEFNAAVDRLASGMLAAGLGKGDRVGVWSPNRA